jgi:hypothetical protein
VEWALQLLTQIAQRDDECLCGAPPHSHTQERPLPCASPAFTADPAVPSFVSVSGAGHTPNAPWSRASDAPRLCNRRSKNRGCAWSQSSCVQYRSNSCFAVTSPPESTHNVPNIKHVARRQRCTWPEVCVVGCTPLCDKLFGQRPAPPSPPLASPVATTAMPEFAVNHVAGQSDALQSLGSVVTAHEHKSAPPRFSLCNLRTGSGIRHRC